MMENVQKNNIVQYECNKVALLSDIHSNFYALKACIEDAEKEGADCFVFLGDYVSGLADPVKTLDLVYEIQSRHPTVCIRGNRERYMLDHHKGISTFSPGSNTGTFLFTYDCLRESDIAFFASLPIFDVIMINGVLLEIAHATKDSDRCYFEKGDEKIIDVFHQMDAAYLLTGHSHKQYVDYNGNKTILNPGSVGLPQGNGCPAQYALLDIADGTVCCTFRRISYDIEKVIHAQFQSGLIECAKYWAISDLYGVMTGEEYTKMLLSRLYQQENNNQAVLCDEKMWQKFAIELGMCITENEIKDLWKNKMKEQI